MKESTMQVEEMLVNLTPGMAVTVEIKTGQPWFAGWVVLIG